MRRTCESSIKSKEQSPDKGFPPPPSSQTLERILRFTGIVEGSSGTGGGGEDDYNVPGPAEPEAPKKKQKRTGKVLKTRKATRTMKTKRR